MPEYRRLAGRGAFRPRAVTQGRHSLTEQTKAGMLDSRPSRTNRIRTKEENTFFGINASTVQTADQKVQQSWQRPTWHFPTKSPVRRGLQLAMIWMFPCGTVPAAAHPAAPTWSRWDSGCDCLTPPRQGEARGDRPGAGRGGAGAAEGGRDHPGCPGPADPHPGAGHRADQVQQGARKGRCPLVADAGRADVLG